MAKLGDLASLIRSKNAGPFVLTFDIMFDEPEVYRRVKRSGALGAEVVAGLYDVPAEDVQFFLASGQAALTGAVTKVIYTYIMGTIGHRIRESRKKVGLTQEALARECGVSRAAVAQWESDVTRPSLDHLQKAADALDAWLPWLTTGAWSPPPSQQRALDQAQPVQGAVPVVDYFHAGKWDLITDPRMLDEGTKFITTDLDVGSMAFALIVTGESMLPEFQEGDLIIIDPEVVPKPGDFVIARLDLQVDGTFMKYRPRGTGKSGQPIIELVPLNEDWPTQTINATNPGHIIGTLVEHRRYRRRKSG